MARAVGPTGHVDAFEANPRMYELLNDSILINDCQSIVTTHPNAALDRAGPVEFQIHPRFAGSGNVVVPGYLDAACQHIEVVGVRLDDVLDAGPPVDLLRMDAEGSEPLVLRGGEGLLRRSPGMRIVMEFSTIMMRTRVDVPEFIAWLATFSFKAWRIKFLRSAGWRRPGGPAGTRALRDRAVTRCSPGSALTLKSVQLRHGGMQSLLRQRRDRLTSGGESASSPFRNGNSCPTHPFEPADKSSSTNSSRKAWSASIASRANPFWPLSTR